MINDSPNLEPLEALAERIVRCANEADERTLEAARLVREARERIKAGEFGNLKWTQWAKDNIKLSATRLRELQRIAEAPDPAAELARLREMARKRVEKHREKKGSAPLRNGGAAVREDVAPEPDRDRLIDRLITWAREAPLQRVAEVLAYIDRVYASESESDVPAEQ